jgi:hypothetical protein
MSSDPKVEPVEPIIWLLSGMILVLLIALFVDEIFFSSDGQIFQVIAGLVSGVTGAFLARIKPANKTDSHTSDTPTTTTEASKPDGTSN